MGAQANEPITGESGQFALGITLKGFHPVNRIQKLHQKITKATLLAKTYAELYFNTELDQLDALAHFQKLIEQKQTVKTVKLVDIAESKAQEFSENAFKAALNRLIGNIETVTHGSKNRKLTDGIFIRELPRDITRAEIEEAFPTAVDVTVLVPQNQSKNAGVAITMPSPADALKTRKGKRVTIRGIDYRPEFQRDGKLTVRHAKRLSKRGSFVVPAKKRPTQAPRYFMEKGVEIKEEKMEPEEVDSYMKIYD